MKFTKILILFYIISFVSSCGTFGEVGKALRNEKAKSTDEFLIKKKEPLTQPPDFENIPEPGSIESKETSNQDKIKRILKTKQTDSTNGQNSSSSTEDSILKQINK